MDLVTAGQACEYSKLLLAFQCLSDNIDDTQAEIDSGCHSQVMADGSGVTGMFADEGDAVRSAQISYILNCPDETLIHVFKHAVPCPCTGKRGRLNFSLTCRRFDGLIRSVEDVKARELACTTYALAAVIRPYWSLEKREGLLRVWIPMLCDITTAMTRVAEFRTRPQSHASVTTAGLYIMYMLYRLHEPGSQEWRAGFGRLPLWCVKAMRVASITVTELLLEDHYLDLEKTVMRSSDMGLMIGPDARILLPYQAVELCLLKDGIRGQMCRAITGPPEPIKDRKSYCHTTSTPSSLSAEWKKLAICEHLKNSGNATSGAYQKMLYARLDLLVTARLLKDGKSTYLAEHKHFNKLRASAPRGLECNADDPGFVKKLKEIRDMLLDKMMDDTVASMQRAILPLVIEHRPEQCLNMGAGALVRDLPWL